MDQRSSPAANMLKSGLLNPAVLSLLARVRHTNTLVIADRGFPFWPQIETVDLSLVDDIPTVLQVLTAIQPYFVCGGAFMAREAAAAQVERVRRVLGDVPVHLEAHIDFKQRVPQAIGLIRTADTVPYANIILESA